MGIVLHCVNPDLVKARIMPLLLWMVHVSIRVFGGGGGGGGGGKLVP